MLKWGSIGEPVRLLQTQLNLLPTKLAALKVDGIFGVRTNGRVLEFQGDNKLARDGVVGPLTADLIVNLLKDLNKILPVPPPMPHPRKPPAVRAVTGEVLTFGGPFNIGNNMVTQIIPAIGIIKTASYKPGGSGKPLEFTFSAPTTARLGVFACQKDGVERAAILLLPATTNPDRLLICISHGFGGQRGEVVRRLESFGWRNPLSKPLIEAMIMSHIVTRWGAQMLASKKQMAFLYIVRSGAPGGELGPFAADGAFLKQVLTEMRDLTNGAFSFSTVETMTYSSGLNDHNRFIGAIQGSFNVSASYVIDPKPQGHASTKNAKRRMFWSGAVNGQPPMAGAEFLPLGRWKDEPQRHTLKIMGPQKYLHEWAMPYYCLYLALQTS